LEIKFHEASNCLCDISYRVIKLNGDEDLVSFWVLQTEEWKNHNEILWVMHREIGH
jgi:hypothetical protein